MTITEFATLEILESDGTADSPQVLQFFRKVSQRQTSWSGYPLLFFQDASSPRIIYLISGWQDIPAHNEWIASEGNQELLREMISVMAVKDFKHLNCDFRTMPLDISCIMLEVVPDGQSVDHEKTDDARAAWQCEGRALERPSDGLYRLRGYKVADEGKHPQVNLASSGSGKERGLVSEVLMHRLIV